MAETDAVTVWRERRKFGTDTPHEPTDEFVVQAFAEGARSLWPDSRDPGWHVTFRRWLAAHDAAVLAALDTPPALGDDERAAVRALRALVMLKDGPRDSAYYADKERAWEDARGITARAHQPTPPAQGHRPMTRENACVEGYHIHVGQCQRAGYANGLADAQVAAMREVADKAAPHHPT